MISENWGQNFLDFKTHISYFVPVVSFQKPPASVRDKKVRGLSTTHDASKRRLQWKILQKAFRNNFCHILDSHSNKFVERYHRYPPTAFILC